ncbi:MAG TPA: polysaccharide biosynthesis tyrosine autokinase [Actinomycetota bacterium]|nr:polysaccharide biosynthesis tyrosine autokinase [Actinomycetota bacterium]
MRSTPTTTTPPERDEVDLRIYLAALRRWSRLILIATAIGLVVALVYSLFRSPTFQSTAKVLVAPIDVSPLGEARISTDIATEREVARSTAVAALARREIGAPESTRELLEDLDVEIAPETDVLSFTFSASDPEAAQERAQAFADAYGEYKAQQARLTYAQLRREIELQILELSERIEAVSRQIAGANEGSAEQGTAIALRDSLATQIAELRGQVASLAPLGVTRPQVIEPAEFPSSRSSPQPLVDMAGGAFLGLLVGSGLALFRDRRGARWQGALDLVSSLRAPVLAMIPRTPELDRERPRVITVRDPGSPASEAYRELRAHLLRIVSESPSRGWSVLVTTAGAAEGKSTTAANLAVTLAQAGKRTLLVSADLRRGEIEQLFGLRKEPGLANVLSGERGLAEAIQSSGLPDLWILASGSATPHQLEMLQSEPMQRFLRSVEMVDFVIIDSPPLLPVADALAIAPMVQGVLFVADARRTTRGAVTRAREQLDQVEARLLGIVLNNVPVTWGSRDDYGGYGRAEPAVKNLTKAKGPERDGEDRRKNRASRRRRVRERRADATKWLQNGDAEAKKE